MFASRQKQYNVALLDRYREALETAVQISCHYNVPPLPGQTVIVISEDLTFSTASKEDFCLPPDPEQQCDEGEEEDEESCRRRKNQEEKRFSPTVRPCFLSNNTKGI